MKSLSKSFRKSSRRMKRKNMKKKIKTVSMFEEKALFLKRLSHINIVKLHNFLLKRYYKKQLFYKRYKVRKFVKRFIDLDLKWLVSDFLRWVFVDLLRGRKKKTFGIYQYIALPGEGKTMSMVAHMERWRKDMISRKKDFIIATNFNYVHENYSIGHWFDIVRIAKEAYNKGIPVLIGMDEIHVTFDSSEWKDFPAELLAVLSFCRKYDLQFLVSAQIYERIPKKIRDIAKYTVVCENFMHLDRLFINYYYEKDAYDTEFADTKGKKKKSKFTRRFVAGDDFYLLYDTKQQVDRMVSNAKEEKKRREEASVILYRNNTEA